MINTVTKIAEHTYRLLIFHKLFILTPPLPDGNLIPVPSRSTSDGKGLPLSFHANA